MWEALQFDFMRNALLAGVLVSISCGIIGSLVVVNRIVFISGGIAHAAFGGIGLAFFLGFSPSLGASLFAVGVAIIMGAVSFKSKHRADTIIGVLWAIGMALGIILIDLTPGYHVDLMSYLFGSILTVPGSDIWIIIILNLGILLTVLIFYKEFIAMSYDEEFAFIVGIPVKPLILRSAWHDCPRSSHDHTGCRADPGHRFINHPTLHCGKIHQIIRRNDGAFIDPRHSLYTWGPVALL